jgi:hypothetical protein
MQRFGTARSVALTLTAVFVCTAQPLLAPAVLHAPEPVVLFWHFDVEKLKPAKAPHIVYFDLTLHRTGKTVRRAVCFVLSRTALRRRHSQPV